jgi:hypothetical protein
MHPKIAVYSVVISLPQSAKFWGLSFGFSKALEPTKAGRTVSEFESAQTVVLR